MLLDVYCMILLPPEGEKCPVGLGHYGRGSQERQGGGTSGRKVSTLRHALDEGIEAIPGSSDSCDGNSLFGDTKLSIRNSPSVVSDCTSIESDHDDDISQPSGY